MRASKPTGARPRAERTLRAATAALAFALPAGALADWTLVAADNGIYSAYADKATIRKSGSIVTMQGLYEFTRGDRTPEGESFFSTTVEREYDCAERRVRLMAYADHAAHFGQGRVVSSARRTRRWEDVVEGGIDDAYWKVACGQI